MIKKRVRQLCCSSWLVATRGLHTSIGPSTTLSPRGLTSANLNFARDYLETCLGYEVRTVACASEGCVTPIHESLCPAFPRASQRSRTIGVIFLMLSISVKRFEFYFPSFFKFYIYTFWYLVFKEKDFFLMLSISVERFEFFPQLFLILCIYFLILRVSGKIIFFSFFELSDITFFGQNLNLRREFRSVNY